MRNIKKIGLLVLVGAVIFVAYLLSRFVFDFNPTQRELNLRETEIKNKAIQDCFSAATVTTKADNTERKEPIFYIYQLCIQDKGYETHYVAK